MQKDFDSCLCLVLTHEPLERRRQEWQNKKGNSFFCFFLDISLPQPWTLSQRWPVRTQELDYLGPSSDSAIMCHHSTWSHNIQCFVSMILKTKIGTVTASSASLKIKLIEECKDLESWLDYHKCYQALITVITASFFWFPLFPLSIIYIYILLA